MLTVKSFLWTDCQDRESVKTNTTFRPKEPTINRQLQDCCQDRGYVKTILAFCIADGLHNLIYLNSNEGATTEAPKING